MQATISRWGNSLALRLPRHLTEEARLSEGACVEIEIKDGSILVTPTRKKFSLAELLAGEPVRQPVEQDWGKPKGEETW